METSPTSFHGRTGHRNTLDKNRAMNKERIVVDIRQRSLRGSSGDSMQEVATVYLGQREFRVVAPTKAQGDVLALLDNLSVRHLDEFGAQVETQPTDRVRVIMAVKDELGHSHQDAKEQTGMGGGRLYYHVRLHTLDDPSIEVKFDLGHEELEKRILEPYRNLRPIVLGGRTIPVQKLRRVEVYETSHPSSEFNEWIAELARQTARQDWHYGEKGIKDVTDCLITTPSAPVIPQKNDAIELLCDRFHIVARQLRSRHNGRPTLDVNDEYDVQDLLHALLRLFFDDVRPEEYTPSYAGKSSKMDFLLPEEGLVVETKKTRVGLGAKELGSELIEDIARYRNHPRCKMLVCFVYDPEGRITNPRGIENDLSRQEGDLEVKVIIAPAYS